jgi:hypothetical protein
VSAALEGTDREAGFWSDDYWLAHSEGYCAETMDGRLGYVEEVVLAPGGEEVFALLVDTGFGDRGVVTVTSEDVLEVDVSGERILLRAGAYPYVAVGELALQSKPSPAAVARRCAA